MTAAGTPRERPHDSRVAGAVALAALLMGFVVVAWSLPIDDFWLSIASGRIIRQGADPFHAIPLSWLPTVPGALNPQWGAEIILGAPGSLGWALTVNAALIAVGLLMTLLRVARRGPPAAVAIALFATLAVLAVHLLARTQSFSVALFPVALLLVERAASRWWLPGVVGVVFAAWANLHGAFVAGQIAAACVFLGAIWAWRAQPTAATRRRLVILGGAVVAALLGSVLNPAGPTILAYAYGQGASDLVRAISVEWQPSWPWEPVAALFWVYAAALLAGRIIRRGGAPSGDLALAVVFGILAAGSLRQIPWFVLATAPMLAADVAALLSSRPHLARVVGAVPPRLRGARLGATLLVLVAIGLAIQPLRPVGPEALARLTPDEPADVLVPRLSAELGPRGSGRILNEQTWGGYLSWRFDGRLAIAMDGRIEIRSRATWSDYFGLMAGDGDPARLLARDGVDWALVSTARATLVEKLLAAGWTRLAQTPQGVLLRRR